MSPFACRPNCAACCIAPSITTPLPNMPMGKPSGVPCRNLNPDTMECTLWGGPDYPGLCKDFIPSAENCGSSPEEAVEIIRVLEQQTSC